MTCKTCAPFDCECTDLQRPPTRQFTAEEIYGTKCSNPQCRAAGSCYCED